MTFRVIIATFLMLTVPLLVSANDFIAELDAVDLEKNSVVVGGQKYSINKSSLRGDAPGKRRALRLSDLKAGMPVHIITRGDHINTLEILPGETELPD